MKNQEIPECVQMVSDVHNLQMIKVKQKTGEALIYLHGAHLTHYTRAGEPPLLFMSAASEFMDGKPIRGGVPVIFPWFGGRDGLPAHGTARITAWEFAGATLQSGGYVRLAFRMPHAAEQQVEFIVTIGPTLTMELNVRNLGDEPFTFENCLHTYFHVGDVTQIEIAGLKGARYLDSLTGNECVQTQKVIHIDEEVDRIYQNTRAMVRIHDPVLGRTIRVRKSGSLSTVVWNPWINKSRRMPDFGDDEFGQMICVESGNVKEHAVTLAPGASSSLKVKIERSLMPRPH